MCMIIRKVVVLPEPLGPMKPYSDPDGTVRSRSSTATTFLKRLVTFRIVMALLIVMAG